MVQAMILEEDIDNNLWPEIVLAMIHVKNLQPTRALKSSISPIEMQDQALLTLQYLWILGSNIYIFLYEEEQSLKSAKWEARALKNKLVGFDGHIIYRVYIKDQNKVMRVKNLQIYKDITFKAITFFSDFDGKSTFDGIQIPDKQTQSNESNTSKEEKNTQK